MRSLSALRRILVASDFTERTEPAERYARELALQFQVPLLIVNAIEPISGLDDDDEGEKELETFYQVLRRRAEEEATKRVESWGAEDISVDYHIEIGPRWYVILDQAQKNQVDLMILGRRTYEDSSSVVFGTTSQKVFFGSKIPVLFVPSVDS